MPTYFYAGKNSVIKLSSLDNKAQIHRNSPVYETCPHSRIHARTNGNHGGIWNGSHQLSVAEQNVKVKMLMDWKLLRLRAAVVLSPFPRIPPENYIPLGLLAFFGTLSVRSPTWTAISLLLLIISLHVIYKRIRKKCSSFYFSFTLCSFIGSQLVYEYIGSYYLRISHYEYMCHVFMFSFTLYAMYRCKIAVGSGSPENGHVNYNYDQDRDYNNDPMERKKLAMAQQQQQIPSYNYCRRCQATIPGRDHHCVWLNVCIGRGNRYWFLGCLAVSACWIAQIANIYFNSVCYPVSMFRNGLLSGGRDAEGPVTWLDHYGLVPVTCPEAYVKTWVTIPFVISIYGLVVLLFIIAVLAHQLRLLYKGVTYLELKYATNRKPVKPPIVKSSKPLIESSGSS